MKKLVLFLVIILSFKSAQAQFKMGIGPQVNIPLNSDFSLGAGFSADAKYMITEQLGIGITIGYQHFFMADNWKDVWYDKWGVRYNDANFNLTPIRATLSYYFGTGKLKPYIGMETGINKFHWTYTYQDRIYDELSTDFTETHFAFALNTGMEISLGNTVAFDVNLKYNGFDESYVSGKFGIVVTLGGNK